MGIDVNKIDTTKVFCNHSVYEEDLVAKYKLAILLIEKFSNNPKSIPKKLEKILTEERLPKIQESLESVNSSIGQDIKFLKFNNNFIEAYDGYSVSQKEGEKILISSAFHGEAQIDIAPEITIASMAILGLVDDELAKIITENGLAFAEEDAGLYESSERNYKKFKNNVKKLNKFFKRRDEFIIRES